MDITDIQGWVEASKSAVDLLKSAYTLLPKGAEREEIQAKVQLAEDILKRSDAKLAKDLGFSLCQCTFPPNIMLWVESEQSYNCQNLSCKRKISRRFLEQQQNAARSAARGRQSDPLADYR